MPQAPEPISLIARPASGRLPSRALVDATLGARKVPRLLPPSDPGTQIIPWGIQIESRRFPRVSGWQGLELKGAASTQDLTQPTAISLGGGPMLHEHDVRIGGAGGSSRRPRRRHWSNHSPRRSASHPASGSSGGRRAPGRRIEVGPRRGRPRHRSAVTGEEFSALSQTTRLPPSGEGRMT